MPPLKLNAWGNLLDMYPKVECSGHIGHVPSLDTTGVFDIYLLFVLSSQPCWCAQEKKEKEKYIDYIKQLPIITSRVMLLQK